MRSIAQRVNGWRAWWHLLRNLTQRVRELESGLAQGDHRLDALETGVVAHNQRLDALEPDQAQGRRRLDALETGVVAHNQRLDAVETGVRAHSHRLDGLDPLQQLLPPRNLPFAWQAPAPQWLSRAEARVGTPIAQLGAAQREQAFYSYYSEIGGDHRAVLHQQYLAYLPLLQQAWQTCNAGAAGVVTAARHPVLDIGCGAGELLSFLGANSLAAVGIDLSASEVLRCTAAGLTAWQADAAGFLRQTGQCFSAITLLQVIEHLPASQVLPTLQACVERLAPGGILLVETVNLRHALALNGFFTDPTHQTPLSDNYMGFLLQWLGLQDVGVLYTLPEPVSAHVSPQPAMHYCNYTVFGFRL